MEYLSGTDRRQTFLPSTIEEYVEENNPVHFLEIYVNQLDLDKLGFKHSRLAATGRPPYHPGDLLKLYLYGYLNRIRSSRALERETTRNLEVMWLLRRLRPDFKTIADFRKDNHQALKEVFHNFVAFCRQMNLFGGELVAVDGSKFLAVNSRDRNFNARKLEDRLKAIDARLEQYFKELEENDKQESQSAKVNVAEMQKKIDQLNERKAKYQDYQKQLSESGETELSLTDPESRLMKTRMGFRAGFNVQVSADKKHKMILDYEVTNQANDLFWLSPMGKRAKEILEQDSLELCGDKGYYAKTEIKKCLDAGIIPFVPSEEESKMPGIKYGLKDFHYDKERDVYVCPCGELLEKKKCRKKAGMLRIIYEGRDCVSCKEHKVCATGKGNRTIWRWSEEEVIEQMEELMKNSVEKVRARRGIIEHIFGTIKRGFNQGYLLLKGKEKVSGEIALSFLAYNLRRALNILGIKGLLEQARTGIRGLGELNSGEKLTFGKQICYFVMRLSLAYRMAG